MEPCVTRLQELGGLYLPSTSQTSNRLMASGEGMRGGCRPEGQDPSTGTGTKIVFSVVSNYNDECPASLILSYQHWAGWQHQNSPDLCVRLHVAPQRAMHGRIRQHRPERRTYLVHTHTHTHTRASFPVRGGGEIKQRGSLSLRTAALVTVKAARAVTGRCARTSPRRSFTK